MPASVIGIDVGTSGVRAAALADDGALVGSADVAMSAFGEAAAPETWWGSVQACLQNLGRSVDLGRVRALAVDGTSGTTVAVDRFGAPVGPARMYDEPCDDEAILRVIAEFSPADSPARGKTSALARVLMMQHRPGVTHMLHQADWIAGKLSGRFQPQRREQRLEDRLRPCREPMARLDRASRRRCREIAPRSRPRRAHRAVGPEAVRFGLPASAIVHAGTTDGCASFLATGAVEVGDGVTALGSTMVVKLLCDRPIFASEFGIYTHRIGSAWLAGGASNTGKVIEQFFSRDRLIHLSAALKPDEPTGLKYYPLVRPGERFPVNDPELQPQLEPRPKDETTFFQGILEGIADVEALAYRKLVELGAPAPRSIRTVGGGAANSAWMKIRQRKLPAPIEQAQSHQACEGVARLVLRRANAFR